MLKEILEFQNKHKLYDFNLFEVVVSYMEENELDPEELGEAIAQDEALKEMLEKDMIENNYIKGEKQKSQLSEWI